MEGDSIGAEIAEEAFLETATAIVDIPVYSQAEAEQIAKAKFNDIAVDAPGLGVTLVDPPW